jgi:SPP1 family predicted phage head-tail adaptor
MPQFFSIRATDLTVPFVLQRRREVVQSSGEVVTEWETYCTGWAKESTMTPREFMAADVVLSEARRVFTTYHINGIRTSDRLVTGDGRVYDVIQAVQPDGYGTAIHIYCVDMQNAS